MAILHVMGGEASTAPRDKYAQHVLIIEFDLETYGVHFEGSDFVR